MSVNCDVCGRFIGRDGRLETERIDVTEEIAVIGGTCGPCKHHKEVTAMTVDAPTPVSGTSPLSLSMLRAWIGDEQESAKDRLNNPDTWRTDADCLLEIAPRMADEIERLRAEVERFQEAWPCPNPDDPTGCYCPGDGPCVIAGGE